MSDVIMLFPKTGEDIGGSIAPPFSLLSAASLAYKNGYKIKIIDQRTDTKWNKTLYDEIKKSNPLFIGLTCMTGSQIMFALEMAKYAKSIIKVPIVWGGMHPTVMPIQTLKNEYVDIIVHREGEETTLELAEKIEKGKPLKDVKGIAFKENGRVVQNPLRSLLDINTLPDIPWELINVEDYISSSLYIEKGKRMLDIGETSRGCPFGCGFCCSSAVREYKWRPMKAKKAAEKIVNTVQRFNLDSIWIRDDNFFVDLKRSKEIFEMMIKEGLDIQWYTAGTRIDTFLQMNSNFIHTMKKSGASAFKFGAESGCNRILELINKGQTREDILAANRKALKYEIIPSYAFIGGFPTETIDELMMTIDLMIQLPKENPKAIIDSIGMFTPHPRTKLYDLALEHGLKPPTRLEDWASWSFFNEAQMTWFTEKEKKVLRNACDICIYSDNLIRALKTIKDPIERIIFLTVFTPLQKYYNYKWKNKKFGYDPFLRPIRFARKIFIDKSLKT